MGIIKTMKLSDIKISESFANTTPVKKKMEECRNYWNRYHSQDRYIVVNHDGVLVDGYIQYLILKENGVEEVEIQRAEYKEGRHLRKRNRKRIKKSKPKITYRDRETTYIYGVHEKTPNKEYVWRVPVNWWKGYADTINEGGLMLVKTNNGRTVIKVTRIDTTDVCPVSFPVKTVIRKVREREDF